MLPLGVLAETVELSPEAPQVLTLWHYYNGAQQQIFDELVLEFNETIGLEKGIVIAPVSQGGVNDLADKLMDSANRKTGAARMPDIFAAYADTAHAMNQMDLVADISRYMTAEEEAEYMDAYIQEGRLDASGALKVFPIAKSTEMMLVNKTEWDAFAAATGAQVSLLSTWEGVVEASRMYYEWSGGKAFFGRDAFANYILIGSLQLGVEMFSVEDGIMTLNLDEAVMRRLWDNYVVPYVNGWFGAYGRYRSDDVKTGQLVALVGSTSGALYFPAEVTRDDGSTYPIECMTLPLPNFRDTQPCAVQQGAGMVVTKSTPEREYAATVFLKWFTQTENNIVFSLNSGYLPVKKEANQSELLHEVMEQQNMTGLVHDIIDIGVQITSSYRLYTNNAFDNGYEARQVVDASMAREAERALEQLGMLTEGGMDRQAALELLTGDEAFASWMESFRKDMMTALK
ncbi:MAG: extracellular solute-binding protein [Clostridiales bacterium]|nr:extracellular solute-binding protein [Clostridiales bacterium]